MPGLAMAFLGYIGEENVSAQDILDYAEQTDYWYYYTVFFKTLRLSMPAVVRFM